MFYLILETNKQRRTEMDAKCPTHFKLRQLGRVWLEKKEGHSLEERINGRSQVIPVPPDRGKKRPRTDGPEDVNGAAVKPQYPELNKEILRVNLENCAN